MAHALVLGGTRFVGRHTVEELLDAGDDVTIFTRGNNENPFGDDVAHVEGDRTDDGDLAAAATEVDPDVVIDCVAYEPRDVRVATRIFDDVDAYVYVSSGSSYGADHVPKREGKTPLCPYPDDGGDEEYSASYGARKAEGDRAVFEAAENGVNAMAVRPCVIYGPHDYTERLDYWIDRIASHDRILVPGDGTNLWHRAYVEDVARALRIVTERGEPGEAYNVADRRLVHLDGMVELIADALDTDVETVHAGNRELGMVDLMCSDFPLYRNPPHVLSTAKLAALGWESTPLDEAMERTVAESVDSDRDGRDLGPSREDEERVLGVLDTI